MMSPASNTKPKVLDMTGSLPTDEVTVENQLAVLRFIVGVSDRGSKSITTDEVAALAAAVDCDRDRVARCIPFFVSTGLVERASPRGPLKPTAAAVEFADADDTRGKATLRGIFANAWFGKAVAQALKVAGRSDEEKLLKVLSRAGRIDFRKAKRAKDKTKKLIEYLVHAGYLAEDAAGYYDLS